MKILKSHPITSVAYNEPPDPIDALMRRHLPPEHGLKVRYSRWTGGHLPKGEHLHRWVPREFDPKEPHLPKGGYVFVK